MRVQTGRGHATLFLTLRQALAPGSYTLALSRRLNGHMVTVRQGVTVVALP